MKRTLENRLKALAHVREGLSKHHGDRLLLKKAAFSATRGQQDSKKNPKKIPEQARKLIAFTRLNVAADEIRMRQERALPVEEKEARFISIRSLLPVLGADYDLAIAEFRVSRPKYSQRELLALTFSPGSRDCRIREGDFLLTLSNEEPTQDLDGRWYARLGLDYYAGQKLLQQHGLGKETWLGLASLAKMLQVELALLDASAETPWLILTPSSPSVFQFAKAQGLLDLDRPMVLDPLHQDFESALITEALKLVGGDPPPKKARRK